MDHVGQGKLDFLAEDAWADGSGLAPRLPTRQIPDNAPRTEKFAAEPAQQGSLLLIPAQPRKKARAGAGT